MADNLPTDEGNHPDRLNPGELAAAEKFPQSATSHTNSHSNDPSDTDVNPNQNINDTKQAEQNAPWETKVSKDSRYGGKKISRGRNLTIANAKAILRKKGAVGLIITVVLGGTVGLGVTSLPSLLIVHMKETLTQALDDSKPALSNRTMKMLGKKADGIKNSFSESSDGKCNIKCKFGTMSDTMLRNLEANDFHVDIDRTIAGRTIVKSITFPGEGEVPIKNGKDFIAALNDPARLSAFNSVFNSKTAYFLNSKFGSMLSDKFGLDKAAKAVGDTKEKVKASIRKALGLTGESAATDPAAKLTDPAERLKASPFKAVTTAVESAQGKMAAKGANIAGMACAAYDISKGITFAEKASKIAAFTTLAMLILNNADQIKAGTADPTAISVIGDQLTQMDTNQKNADGTDNAFYMKSATDSAGYQMAAYNDTPALSDQDKKYGAAPLAGSTIGILGGLTAFITKGGVGALTAAHTICQGANNPALAVATSCPEEVAAGIAGLATAGTVTVGAALACAAKVGLTIVSVGFAVTTAMGLVIPALLKDDLPNVDENLQGAALGDAAYTGSAQILGGKSATYGLKAGTQADVKQYALDTAAIKQKDATIARYDARNTPFDIYNQYSFLGSMVNNLQVADYAGSSFASNFGKLMSLVPTSLASLTTNAGALSNATTANNKASLYGACADQALQSVGVEADAFCNPSYVMSSGEMNADIDTVTQAMIDGDTSGSYINADTGEATPGSDYQKYLDNCANRKDPLGETSVGIDDGDYLWKVGQKCQENSPMLSNFRTYTMDKAINDTMDGDTTTNTPSSQGNTGTVSSIAIKDDYPWPTASVPGGSPIGYNFRECVDFAAWRLNEQAGINGNGPFKFNGFGYASQWKDRAIAQGYTADKNPAIGSVAWWGPDVTAGQLTAGSTGHVGIVSAKNADGSLLIEQYNGMAAPNDHKYSTATIPASDIPLLYYLHIADIKTGATS